MKKKDQHIKSRPVYQQTVEAAAEKKWWDDVFKEAHSFTREQREMDRLRDYLAYPRWRWDEAVWILAGIDPESPMGGHGELGYAWLPGGLRENWRNHDGSLDPFIVEQHVNLVIKDLQGFIQGESRSPRGWVEHALSLKYEPPWLDAARQDSECQVYFRSPPAPAETSAPKQMQALGGRAKAKKNLAKLFVVHRWDEWQRDEAEFTSDAHFIKEMQDEYYYPERPKDGIPAVTGVRTIAGWVSDLRREAKTGVTKAWIQRARMDFAELKQSA